MAAPKPMTPNPRNILRKPNGASHSVNTARAIQPRPKLLPPLRPDGSAGGFPSPKGIRNPGPPPISLPGRPPRLGATIVEQLPGAVRERTTVPIGTTRRR